MNRFTIPAMVFGLLLATSASLHAQSDNTVQNAINALDAAVESIDEKKTAPPAEPPSTSVKDPPSLPSKANVRAENPPQDWQIYVNKRFGTRIHYPADLLPTGFSSLNGDGVTMKSSDGRIELRVFGGFNALEHTPREHEAWLRGDMRNGAVTYKARNKEWFVLSGMEGGSIFYEKRLFSADGETIHGFSFRYPAAEKTAMDPIVERLSKTFALSETEEARTLQPPKIDSGNAVTTFWSPKLGDPNRKAILNAVRPAIERDTGGPVEFVVYVIRTNGAWAYLQASPQRPGGVGIDWTSTKFGAAIAEGSMSEIVMALLKRSDSSWRVEDYVLGPTDVYWAWWVTDRNIPERLFHDGKLFVD